MADAGPEPATAAQRDSNGLPRLRISWVVGVLLAAVLLTFSPLFSAKFADWDDNHTIVENPQMSRAAGEAIAKSWSNWRQPLGAIYIPVTETAWRALAGMAREPSSNTGSA